MQKIKALLPISRDSHNTYVHAELEVTVGMDKTTLRVTDSDREITVSTLDLQRVISIFK